jgi:hypothetical protein
MHLRVPNLPLGEVFLVLPQLGESKLAGGTLLLRFDVEVAVPFQRLPAGHYALCGTPLTSVASSPTTRSPSLLEIASRYRYNHAGVGYANWG